MIPTLDRFSFVSGLIVSLVICCFVINYTEPISDFIDRLTEVFKK